MNTVDDFLTYLKIEKRKLAQTNRDEISFSALSVAPVEDFDFNDIFIRTPNYIFIAEKKFKLEHLKSHYENGGRYFFLTSDKDIQRPAYFKDACFLVPSTHPSVHTLENKIVYSDQLDSGADYLLSDTAHLDWEGADHVLQGAFLITRLIQGLDENEKYKFIFKMTIDSETFSQIAYIRAVKFLVNFVREKKNLIEKDFFFITQSVKEMTLFDSWMNSLRSCSVAFSGLVAGIDGLSLNSYLFLHEHYNPKQFSADEYEKAERLAFNTFNTLFHESHLSQVANPVSGSYSIDELTHSYAQAIWEKVQKILQIKDINAFYQESKDEIKNFRENKEAEIVAQKRIISGVNNFCQVDESYPNAQQLPREILTASFENFRMENQKKRSQQKIKIYILGEQRKLNARLNFVWNFFSIAGLAMELVPLSDVAKINAKTDDINVFIASDDDYQQIFSSSIPDWFKSSHFILAGKAPLEGMAAITAKTHPLPYLMNLLGEAK